MTRILKTGPKVLAMDVTRRCRSFSMSMGSMPVRPVGTEERK